MKVKLSMLDAISRKNQLQERIDHLRTEIKTNSDELTLDNITLDGLMSDYISKRNLISDFSELKGKINESNALTKIIVNGKEYSMADAIARHRVIKLEKSTIKYIKNQLNLFFKNNPECKDECQELLNEIKNWETEIDAFDYEMYADMIRSNATTFIECDLTTI